MADRTMRFEFSTVGVWTYRTEDGTEVVIDDGSTGMYPSVHDLLRLAWVAERAIEAKTKRDT